MRILRRSIRRRRRKHRVIKHKVDYLGGQIDKFKVIKHADNEISDCKVDKNMLDRPNHVQITELKQYVASRRLHNYKFGCSNFGCLLGTMSAPYESSMNMGPYQPQQHYNERKCGRPRNYVASSVAMPVAIMPTPHPQVIPSLLLPPPPSGPAPSSTAAGSGLIEINPEVITVHAGQDIGMKIMSLCGNGWAVCVLSAHGVVSIVTLHQGASSSETAIYEGYFEMLSLCGSYQPSETDGMSIRTGGLSVSLASLDGRVFGGKVSGPLVAASPVQVVTGRFPVDEKNKLKWAATRGILGSSSSIPEGALDGSSRKPRSPPN